MCKLSLHDIAALKSFTTEPEVAASCKDMETWGIR
jgi:hypothetical protein